MNIPYGKQNISGKDTKSVDAVLRSDWITQGSKVGEFEACLARYCNSKFAVAVSSGTAALHLACLAAGIGKGDEAITSPITFLATPNSVLYTGAKPVFSDIDYETVNISPVEISKNLTRRTRVILPVHFAGLPCKMPEISKIARKNKLIVIEDGCHALGAEYKHGKELVKVGSCRHSHMTVFSFHPVKHITTGEGGAITTNSKELYKKLCMLRTHGVYRDQKMARARGGWYYEMRSLGFNYRITDFQCSLGISQMGRIDRFLSERRKMADVYDKEFSGMGEVIRIPNQRVDSERHAYHLYLLRLNPEYIFFSGSPRCSAFSVADNGRKVGLERNRVIDELIEKGIRAQVHYIPVYKQPYYRENGYGRVNCISSEKYFNETISLPIYPGLSTDQQGYVIKNVKKALCAAAKKSR